VGKAGIAICGKTAINPALTLRAIIVARGLISRRCASASGGVEIGEGPVRKGERGVSARVGLRHRSKGGIKGEE
jgi:hypothetical protein